MRALAIAQNLAAQGWPVFPCAPDKSPAISKREGGRGLHDATTDTAAIRRMFSRNNAILVGVPTGEVSGFDVLDLDYRHGAGDWERANKHCLPETRTHQTQSGGRHLLFRHAPGMRNSASKIGLGVDTRGGGGYAIFPPSPGYSIVLAAEIAHWPDWLLTLALPPPEKPRPVFTSAPRQPVTQARLDRIIAGTLDRVRAAPEGGKHFQLRNAALLLGGIADQAGFDDAAAMGWLLGALAPSVRDWRGAEATAAWGLENGRARPLAIPVDPSPHCRDPRRKETAREACRLLRRGMPSADLLVALQDQNRRRPNPLPASDIVETALWAAHRMTETAHAG